MLLKIACPLKRGSCKTYGPRREILALRAKMTSGQNGRVKIGYVIADDRKRRIIMLVSAGNND